MSSWVPPGIGTLMAKSMTMRVDFSSGTRVRYTRSSNVLTLPVQAMRTIWMVGVIVGSVVVSFTTTASVLVVAGNVEMLLAMSASGLHSVVVCAQASPTGSHHHWLVPSDSRYKSPVTRIVGVLFTFCTNDWNPTHWRTACGLNERLIT